MCTVDQLKELMEQRFNELEGALVRHADIAPASISKQYGEIRDHMKEHAAAVNRLNDTITKHNGRLTKIESWKLRLEGASIVTKGIWGVVGVFVIASTFGLFNMYIAYKQLPSTITEIVRAELGSGHYQFDIVQ